MQTTNFEWYVDDGQVEFHWEVDDKLFMLTLPCSIISLSVFKDKQSFFKQIRNTDADVALKELGEFIESI